METKKKVPSPMQRSHLKARLVTIQHNAHAMRRKIERDISETAEPAAITKARAKIKLYEDARTERLERLLDQRGLHYGGTRDAIRKAQEQLYFYTPEEALASIIELEKKYPGV